MEHRCSTLFHVSGDLEYERGRDRSTGTFVFVCIHLQALLPLLLAVFTLSVLETQRQVEKQWEDKFREDHFMMVR